MKLKQPGSAEALKRLCNKLWAIIITGMPYRAKCIFIFFITSLDKVDCKGSTSQNPEKKSAKSTYC